MGSDFTLKNATPGTCFAFFGVIIISVMLINGSPEVTLKQLKKAPRLAGKTENSSNNNNEQSTEDSTEIILKGENDHSIASITKRGIYYEQQKDDEKAIAEYKKALEIVSAPMNYLAWLYKDKEGKLDEALALSRLAVQLSPDNTNFLDTLAEILYEKEQFPEALKYIKKAAEIDPEEYGKKIKKFESKIK